MVPVHNVVADAAAIGEVGAVFTVTMSVVAVVLPHGLVAVSVYIPEDNVPTVMAAGLRSVEVNPSGPLHE